MPGHGDKSNDISPKSECSTPENARARGPKKRKRTGGRNAFKPPLPPCRSRQPPYLAKYTSIAAAMPKKGGVWQPCAPGVMVTMFVIRLEGAVAEIRKRRTGREIFIDKLRELSNGEQKLFSNKSIIGALGWNADKYNKIKSQLINEEALIVGKGHGGTIGLANVPGTKSLSVFVSYSHIDEHMKDSLLKHLKPLEHLGLIDAWHDRKIMPGEEWKDAIEANLDAADIVLLLVSIDFINSGYCYDIELERALELHDAGKSRVVPIILRNCLWQHAPFAKLQALPRDAKAVSGWSDIDEAMTNISEGVRKVAEELIQLK